MSRNKDKLRKKQAKNIKIFLKMKKKKGEKSRYHDFTEEEKEKKLENNLSKEHKMKQAEYRRNYYLRHEK